MTSFNNVKQWMTEIDSYAKKDVSRFIVGNKCDMAPQRAVPTETGKSFAQSQGVPFLETSAKNSDNVTLLFTEMTKEIMSRQPNHVSTTDNTVDVRQNGTKRVSRRRC